MDKIFMIYYTQSTEMTYKDFDMVGVLNFENVVNIQLKVGFFSQLPPPDTPDADEQSPEFLVISGPDLYTERGLKHLAQAEVTLTCDVNLEEYLVFLEK